MMHAPAPALDVLTVTHLNDVLSAPVHGTVPKDRPATFVRVLTAGGAGRYARVLFRGLVVVESWDNDRTAAATLAGVVDAAMFDMADSDLAYSVTCVGAPSFLPDPMSGQARYTATYEITTRAA